MRNRFIIGMSFILLMAWSSANGSMNILNIDGNDWLQYTKSYKTGVAQGVLMANALALYRIKTVEMTVNLLTEGGDKDVLEETFTWVIKSIELRNLALDQIVEGLNTFFSDYRNRNIRLINAIYVVREQIRGENPEYIEAQTRWLRKPKEERRRLLDEWTMKGQKGLRPNAYRATNGKIYYLFDQAP